MKTFIGTKTVKASPMNRLEYNQYRGWELPDDEDGTDEGMLVEYVDGGKANHPDHEGYISWSPLDVFERSYKDATTFKDRLVIEHSELKGNVGKLTSFIDSDKFNMLAVADCDDLQDQLLHMEAYLGILSKRLVRI